MADAKRVKADEVLEQLTTLLEQVEESQKPGFELLARRQSRKQARRRAVAERLAKHLDVEDPRLIQVKQSVQQAGELALAAGQRAKRLEIRPETRADDWLVTGNVRYADGSAAAGVIVKLFDKDHKHDDFLGSTETNDFGDFAIVYSERDFRDSIGDEFPDLYVMVSDKKGKQLISDKTPVRPNAGRSEHFDIQLGQTPVKKRRRSGKSR